MSIQPTQGMRQTRGVQQPSETVIESRVPVVRGVPLRDVGVAAERDREPEVPVNLSAFNSVI